MLRTNHQKRRHRGLCLPGGYRYCGLGCSGPGSPINYVDSCCKAHDDCIRRFGASCKCDRQLIKCVHSRLNQKDKEGQTAKIISSFMKLKTTLNCSNFNR